MARHDGNLRSASGEPLSLAELLLLLDGGAQTDPRSRKDAIACYLSAGEGWREAVKQLGGAFADDLPGLKDRKAD